MLLRDLTKIVFAFCFGFLLSPFSWGLFYLPLFIIIFGCFEYLFLEGEFTYNYFEHRGSIIFYGILGFIVGRTFHNLIVGNVQELHRKLPKKELAYTYDQKILFRDLKLISNISKGSFINISDKTIVSIKDFYYFIYRFIVFTHKDNLKIFIIKTINNATILLKTIKDREILLLGIKSTLNGIENLKQSYPFDKEFAIDMDAILLTVKEIK